MVGFIIRRVLWLIPVLFVVSLITFVLMHAVPGGPWAREKPLAGGRSRDSSEIYGLNKPIWQQYIYWFGGIIQASTSGRRSSTADRTVNDILAKGWPTTVQLGVMAFVLSVAVGIPLGIIAALGHNRWPDYLATGVSMVGIATPSFVLAILLIVVFSVGLNWFPAAAGGPGRSSRIRSSVRSWVLPVHRPRRLPDRPDRADIRGRRCSR